ncbi:hypothetical protein KW489_21720 [Vibrio fluvialis]|nr:hypothetical protein [Vibrio fluvialis]
MPVRLYHYQLNEHAHTQSRGEAADKHSLRLDPSQNPNCLTELTKDNLIYINNQKRDPLAGPENYAEVRQIIQGLKDDFNNSANTNADNEKLSNERKASLQIERTDSKMKISKYLKKDISAEEEYFWNELKEKIGNEKIDTKSEVEKFENLGVKIKQFNAKRSRIEALENFNCLVGTTSRNIGLSVVAKELVFKIPDQYKKEIKPDDFVRLTKAIQKKYFPDFDSIYMTVHMDENGENPHVHSKLSGKNNKTGKFDIQTQLLKRIKELHPDCPIKKNKYSELNEDELIQFGEFYQAEIFKSFNQALKKLNYDFQVVRRTAEEQENDKEIFFKNNRKSSDREYNLQNKLADENKKIADINTDLSFENEVLKNDNEELAEEKETLKEEVKELIEQKTIAQKALHFANSALDKALNYAKTFFKQDVEAYHAEQKQLDEISKAIGNSVNDIATDIQPSQEQKNEVRRGRGLRR